MVEASWRVATRFAACFWLAVGGLGLLPVAGCESPVVAPTSAPAALHSTLTAETLVAGALRPNIVLILADDLGWADLSYNGGRIATPQIDRLTRAGVRLDRFYTLPVCTPARAALLTGRHPIRLGLAGGGPQALPPDGQDVWDLLRGTRTDPEREVLLNLATRSAALLQGHTKLVVQFEDQIPFNVVAERRHRSVELFDVFADPGVTRDLAGQSPEKVRQMLARLEGYRRLAPAEVQRGRPKDRARDRNGAPGSG